MYMIGKLSRDEKVDWPKHLPELVHAYNSMGLAITRYSLHLPDVQALTVLTHLLLVPYDEGHRETPACQLPHC